MSIKISKSGMLVLCILLLLIVIGSWYIVSIDESDVQIRNQTDAAQALVVADESSSFTDTSGVALTLNDYLGEIVVATTWASWCPQCATDLPVLGGISSSYKEQGVIFLAVNRSESLAMAERFLNTLPARPELQFVMDPSDHFFSANEGYAMPETLVYDKNGTIVLHQRGELRQAELIDVLDSLLTE